MYINSKMITVETIPEIRRVGIKESRAGGECNMMYLIYCKNFL
jgi:hypothetical protein